MVKAFLNKFRRKLVAETVVFVLESLAQSGRLTNVFIQRVSKIKIKSFSYKPGRKLDIYYPVGPLTNREKVPIIFYVHGGAFKFLSRKTHWFVNSIFAYRGYLVFSVDYGLTPQHPFPDALEDVLSAYAWVVSNASKHGGDLDNLIAAGESAGANLITALTICTSFKRPEEFAKTVWELEHQPKIVMPCSALLQVTDMERIKKIASKMPQWVYDLIIEMELQYLPEVYNDLIDPLLILENLENKPSRELPEFYVPVGARDVLLSDSRRLKAALDSRKVPCHLAIYRNGIHAFHFFMWTYQARKCWKDLFEYLDDVLENEHPYEEAKMVTYMGLLFSRALKVARKLRPEQYALPAEVHLD